jgi:hypothetical protein
MIQTDAFQGCKLCSEVSKANGEDPIGSAGNYDHFLFIETPEPWTKDAVYEHPQLGVIHKMAKALRQECGVSARVMAIAPDYDSPADRVRVLHYQRPAGLFAQFEKQEFLIPQAALIDLATALLKQSDAVSQFDFARQQTHHLRDMMICTHGSYDLACGRFGYPIYRSLRKGYTHLPLRVWRCSHLGPHNFAPLLIDLPSGHYWGRLEPAMLDLLVERSGSCHHLRPFYVGWAGLSWAEQIAERDIWMQTGWHWLDYLKSGETLAISDPEADYPDWVKVQISFSSPDGSVSGTYEACIKAYGTVKTMWTSGRNQPLWEVKQYQVIATLLIC